MHISGFRRPRFMQTAPRSRNKRGSIEIDSIGSVMSREQDDRSHPRKSRPNRNMGASHCSKADEIFHEFRKRLEYLEMKVHGGVSTEKLWATMSVSSTTRTAVISLQWALLKQLQKHLKASSS